MRDAVIVAYGRSAIGRAPRGLLSKTRPEEVASQVVEGVLNKIPELDVKEIDDVIMGCAFPEAEQGFNVSQIIAQRIGLPDEVPGHTVNRFCASGLQSIAAGANSIKTGEADIIVAGGVESMSIVPMGGNFTAPNPYLMEHNPDAYATMGITAENVADRYDISREEQDEFSTESHRKAYEAQKAGKFAEEIIPVKARRNGKDGIEEFVFEEDEGIRPNTTTEILSNLRPVFKNGGSVTAGNSSQISDGAAAVVLMSEEKAKELGLTPIAKFRSFAASGVGPEVMGLGPIKAIPKALEKANLEIEDLDLVELNEAFASQSIACINELGLDEDIVNVNGGAIALGHPLGCTGSFLTAKLLSEMKRRDDKYGVVSMCIGGGMGAAGVFELLN